MGGLGCIAVSGAGEGALDEVVLRRLVEHVGAIPGPIHGGVGKHGLLRRLAGYNEAARFAPWLVLVDLNGDADCAPTARAEWLPVPAPRMCFRIAVREIEAWLLADRERLARCLSVALSRVPHNPEDIPDPKQAMINLARSSRRRDIREDMIPRPGSGRRVGPAYTSRLTEFVLDGANGWRPNVAAISSDSLSRGLDCLRRLTQNGP